MAGLSVEGRETAEAVTRRVARLDLEARTCPHLGSGAP